MPRAVLLTSLLLLCACSAHPPPAAPPPVQNLSTRCNEPRPLVCTMEYDPVCGSAIDGSSQDYSSPCNACAHDVVNAYQQGSCAALSANATGAR
jgi:Kazal-type serine protease inhibitor domain